MSFHFNAVFSTRFSSPYLLITEFIVIFQVSIAGTFLYQNTGIQTKPRVISVEFWDQPIREYIRE